MKRLLILIFLFFCMYCFGQSKQRIGFDEEELIYVIPQIEKVYNVQFSFNPDVIKNHLVSVTANNYALTELIALLEGLTYLDFEYIKEGFYVIKKNRNIIICGYLLEDDSNFPVNRASILNLSNSNGVTSNDKGFFSLLGNTESDSISISYLGFKTTTISVKSTMHGNCKIYILKPEDQLLTEVILEDYIASGISRQQDGSILFRPSNSEILSGLAEPDILQSIQLLPGIDSPTENASDINIRGGTPDQNLILLDGIKIYSTDHFYGSLSAFNPYIIKEVRVYRSGVKAKYGDRIAGVIDMRIENEVPKVFNFGLGLNMTHFETNIKIPITENIGVITSFRNSISKYFDTPTFSKFSTKIFQGSNIEEDADFFDTNSEDNSINFGFSDANLKILADISTKDKIEATGIFIENKLDYFFKAKNIDRPFKTYTNTQNIGASLLWSRQWNSRFETSVQSYISDFKTSYFAQNSIFGDNYEAEKSNTIKEVGVKIGADIILNDKITLSSGYQYFSDHVSYRLREVIVTENIFENSSYNATNSGFIELTYKGDKLRVDLGVRSNYYSIFKKNVIEPRFYSEYNFKNGFRIKGSAEVKNQLLSQIVEFISSEFGLENHIWTLGGNEFVPLLNSEQFSIGSVYSKKGWKVDIDVYTKKNNGLTGFGRGITLIDNGFITGKSTIKGLDILLKKRLGDYSAWLGYSYSKTQYSFDEINNGKPFNANNDITNSLTLSQFFKWRKFQFSLGYKYRIGIPYTPALRIIGEEGFEEIEFGDFNSKRLPDYKRLDFSLIYNFKLSKEKTTNARLGISLLNILDSKNILERKYSQFSNINSSGEVFEGFIEIDKVGLAFTPNAFFRINF